MSDPASAFFDARRVLTSERLATARAFGEFRKDNPTATITDLQMAAEQIYGPNAWLHGSPRQDMLDSIASQNAERKALADQNNSIALAQRQTEMQKGLWDAATLAARNAPDAATAAANFYGMYGNVPNIREYVKPEAIAGLHSREQLAFAANPQYLDIAVQTLEAGNDISSLFPDAPKSAIAALSSRAKSELANRASKLDQETLQREMQRIKEAVDLGVDYQAPYNLKPELYSKVDEFKKQAFQNARSKLVTESVKEFDGDADIAQRLMTGDLEGTRNSIRQRLNQRLGVRGNATDAEVEVALTAVREKAGSKHSADYAAQQANFQKIAVDQAKKMLEDNQRLVKETIDKDTGGNIFGKNAVGIAARDALQLLSDSGYHINERRIPEIADYVKSSEFSSLMGNRPTPDAARAALQRKFPHLIKANSLGNTAAAMSKELLEANGYFPIENAENWVASTTSSLAKDREEAVTKTRQDVVEHLGKFAHDPEAALKNLTAHKLVILRASERMKETLEARLRNAGKWSAQTGRPFAQEDLEKIMREHTATSKEVVAVLDGAIEKLTVAAQERAAIEARKRIMQEPPPNFDFGGGSMEGFTPPY